MILIQAEVDEQTKASAEMWLNGQGIVPEEAIRMFYREVVACHGLPFGDSRRRAEQEEVSKRHLDEPVFYEEVSAVSIPSVTVELREAHLQGREMLSLLQEFKEQRAMKKAARKAGRRNNAGLEAGGLRAKSRV